MLAHWGNPSPSVESAEEAIHFLESLTAYWEMDAGEVAGVVTIEHPDPPWLWRVLHLTPP